MKTHHHSLIRQPRLLILPTFAGLLLIGCGSNDPEPEIYSAEVASMTQQERWNSKAFSGPLPQGWVVEAIFGMREASLRVPGPDGTEAELSIIRLPLSAGTLQANLNRWRGQAGLPVLEDSVVQKEAQPFKINDVAGWQVEYEAGSDSGISIFGVILEQETERIFIKFSGPPALMNREKANWQLFLSGLEMKRES